MNPLEELINSGSFSPQVKRTLTLMKRNTERLLLLVNNLMDIQKYNSRIPELKKESFNISQFGYEVYIAFKDLAHRKNITYLFRNSLPDNLPVYYDPIELEKVFFNLLSNAFKYTPDDGTVIFEIEWCNKEDDIVHVRSW